MIAIAIGSADYDGAWGCEYLNGIINLIKVHWRYFKLGFFEFYVMYEREILTSRKTRVDDKFCLFGFSVGNVISVRHMFNIVVGVSILIMISWEVGNYCEPCPYNVVKAC